MSTSVPSVFVSATSHDLASYREIVCKELRIDSLHDVRSVVQEDFGPDSRRLRDYLRARVSECDAMICLVGSVYGATPTGIDRSYTQLEYDVAIELGRPIFVCMTAEDFEPDNPAPDELDGANRQQVHRQAMMDADHKCFFFSTHDDLRVEVSRIVRKVHQLVSQQRMLYLHPPTPPAFFVGRQTEIQQIHAALRERAPSVIAIVGMGGQGKTTLLHETLHRIEYYPFATGVWTTAYRVNATFDSFLDEILTHLDRGGYDKREMRDVERRIQRLLVLLQQAPVLLVIDGFERWLQGWNCGSQDLQDAQSRKDRCGFYEGVDSFLEQVSGLSNGTHLILTTRALPAALDRAACQLVPVRDEAVAARLQGLDPDDALELLRSLGIDSGTADDRPLRQLAAIYGHHPLALSVLGAHLAADWGGRIEKVSSVRRGEDFQTALNGLFEEVSRTLSGSSAERMLQTASICLEDPKLATIGAALGLDVQGDEATADRLVRDIVRLAKWNLIDWDGRTEQVRVHPLVRQHFGAQVDDPDEVNQRLVNWYAAEPLPERPESLSDARPRVLLIEHALKLRDADRAIDTMFSGFAGDQSLVEWLATRGHMVAGIGLLDKIISLAIGAAALRCRSSRAAMLRQIGRLPEAATELDRVVASLQQEDGSDSIEDRQLLAYAYVNRANVLWEMGRSPDAIADYDRGLQLLEQLLVGGAVTLTDLVEARMNRGTAFDDLGKLDSALRDQQAAVKLSRMFFQTGQTDWEPMLASALSRLAIALRGQKKNQEGLAAAEEARDIFFRLIVAGQNELRLPYSDVLINLGSYLTKDRRFDEADRHLSEAIEMLQEFIKQGRSNVEPRLGRAQLARGNMHLRQGTIEQAGLDCEEAEGIFKNLCEAGRDEVRGWYAHVLLNRAEFLHRSGRPDEAEQYRTTGLRLAYELINKNEWDAWVTLLTKVRHMIGYLSDELLVPIIDKAVAEAMEFLNAGHENEHVHLLLGELWNALHQREYLTEKLPKSRRNEWQQALKF